MTYPNEELKENYLKALKQKYNAVCFDIDGTLTKPNSRHIDEKALSIIADLIKKQIPIVFITGRGETGFDDLLYDIIPPLVLKYGFTTEDFYKIYVLLNDGTRLIKSSKEENKLFDQKSYLVPKYCIDSLKKFNIKLLESFEEMNLSEYCDISYSVNSEDGNILNMRLNCKTTDSKLNKRIFEIIEKLISSFDKELVVTRGVYEGKTKIQIGVAKKDIAIKRVEELIGIPANSMLRIGDCGDENGNDYTMLNCPQGFSVKDSSNSDECCFPVIDENGNILTGIDATIYLSKKAKIIPTICLEKADEETYRKEYAKIEYQINRGRINQLRKFNETIDQIFDSYGGIDKIFDPNSGSIMLPMYEWELINDDNPLKQLWNTKKDDNLTYALLDNKNILLRGSTTYYYFLANRISRENKENGKNEDYTTRENIENWYMNYIEFLIKAKKSLDKYIDFNDVSNKKMILGLLDNIRNLLLVNINEILQDSFLEDNVIINLEKIEDSILKELYELLLETHKVMINICSKTDYEINCSEIKTIIGKTTKILKEKFNYFLEEIPKENYSKDYRAYREIDNFAENYITVSLVDKKRDNQIYAMCGLSYGGIEIPIIYKALNPIIDDILILKFSKAISDYRSKHKIEVRNFDISDYGGVIKIGFNQNESYILADDNLLTAKTMQLALNTFRDLDASVQSAIVVRYPSINRISQMFLDGHGAVDYNYFFDFIQGLCFPTPYSYRDKHDGEIYQDSLGVFDTNRREIIKALFKNHDYVEGSEVSELKVYSKSKKK